VAGPGPSERAVNGGTSDAEQFGEFGGAVGAEVGELDQMPGLIHRQLRLLAFDAAFGAGNGHAFAGPHSDQVCFKLGDDGEHVEQQPAYGVGRVVSGAADTEPHVSGGEFGEDVAGVG